MARSVPDRPSRPGAGRHREVARDKFVDGEGKPMKKFLLAGMMLTFMAVAAEAQIFINYTRRTNNSTLTIQYNSGYSYGYSGFGYYGFGDYFGGYPGYTTYSTGLGYGGNSFYSGYGMYSYGTMPGLYGGRPYRSPYSMPPSSDYSPGPSRSGVSAARMSEFASA